MAQSRFSRTVPRFISDGMEEEYASRRPAAFGLDEDVADEVVDGVRLTKQQHRTLRFMVSYLKRHRLPPNLAEIGQHLGVSKVTVWEQLRRMERLGVVSIQRRKSRGAIPCSHCPTCHRSWQHDDADQDGRESASSRNESPRKR